MKRVCLLTGAGGKLGTEFCRRYADEYDIAAVYRRRAPRVTSQSQSFVDPLDAAAALPENKNPVFGIRADLMVDDDYARVVELTLARFGRVDLLVHAAVHSVWAPIVESDRLLRSAGAQFGVNVVAPLRLATLLARAFWRDRAAENTASNRNIVHLSSVAGLRIVTGCGQSLYSASKAALNFLSRHMADEFAAFGVRVNTIAPTGFPRLIPTAAVAAAVHRLDHDTVTGKTLIIDRAGERFE